MSTQTHTDLTSLTMDELVRSATAFRSWAEMETSIKTRGYIPTLALSRWGRHDPVEAELATRIRALGHRVFSGHVFSHFPR